MSPKEKWNALIKSASPQWERKISLNDWLIEQELALCRAEREKANGNTEQPSRFCDCPDLLLNGKRLPCHQFHSCEYTRQRSALVEQAAARATEKAGFIPYGDQTWTKCFVSEMEKLSAPLLRQSDNGAGEQKAV